MHTALGDAKPILSKCAGLSWPSHIDWQRWVGRDLKVRAVVVAGGGGFGLLALNADERSLVLLVGEADLEQAVGEQHDAH